MALVGAFTTILENDTVFIGDRNNPQGWTGNFDATGREGTQTAYLTFMARGMMDTAQDATVMINAKQVGSLSNSAGGDYVWQTQTIIFDGTFLNPGINVLHVSTVDLINPDPPDNLLDDYEIRDAICHFHVIV